MIAKAMQAAALLQSHLTGFYGTCKMLKGTWIPQTQKQWHLLVTPFPPLWEIHSIVWLPSWALTDGISTPPKWEAGWSNTLQSRQSLEKDKRTKDRKNNISFLGKWSRELSMCKSSYPELQRAQSPALLSHWLVIRRELMASANQLEETLFPHLCLFWNLLCGHSKKNMLQRWIMYVRYLSNSTSHGYF